MTTKKQSLENIPNVEKSKIIGNNTFEYWQNGVKKIRLHNTDILTFQPDGYVVYNTDGWKTVTTKARLNDLGLSNVSIFQEKGQWYVVLNRQWDNKSIFYDGMLIHPKKGIKKVKTTDKKTDSLLKKINAYCLKLKKLETIPFPDAGDCWYCLMFDKATEPRQKTKNPDHLISHLNQKYIHGSLIANALTWAGYNNPGVVMSMDVRTSIVSSVRRYFKAQLNLVC